jgi:hypothetical protein
MQASETVTTYVRHPIPAASTTVFFNVTAPEAMKEAALHVSAHGRTMIIAEDAPRFTLGTVDPKTRQCFGVEALYV